MCCYRRVLILAFSAVSPVSSVLCYPDGSFESRFPLHLAQGLCRNLVENERGETEESGGQRQRAEGRGGFRDCGLGFMVRGLGFRFRVSVPARSLGETYNILP